MVRTLLDGGADPNKTNDQGESAMDEARRKRGYDIVAMLIDAGGMVRSDVSFTGNISSTEEESD